MIRRIFRNIGPEERLYSTGNDELDYLLEKAFSERYEYAQREYSKKDSSDEKELSKSDKILLGITGSGALAGVGGNLASKHLEDKAVDEVRDNLINYYGAHLNKEDISKIRNGIRENYSTKINIKQDYNDNIKYSVKRLNSADEIKKANLRLDKLAKRSRELKKLGKAGIITASTAGALYLGKNAIDEIKKKK